MANSTGFPDHRPRNRAKCTAPISIVVTRAGWRGGAGISGVWCTRLIWIQTAQAPAQARDKTRTGHGHLRDGARPTRSLPVFRAGSVLGLLFGDDESAHFGRAVSLVRSGNSDEDNRSHHRHQRLHTDQRTQHVLAMAP